MYLASVLWDVTEQEAGVKTDDYVCRCSNQHTCSWNTSYMYVYMSVAITPNKCTCMCLKVMHYALAICTMCDVAKCSSQGALGRA